ncbi:MAG: cation:proton antiporter [Actinobacteria bacterium RBG_19FT_COMBO_54_7]|uniref:Cation:proton antiporter n=1 Tax=Candidatus Solincola sediminis TaxID=1797199 RepID=A0A1F2WH28_9ACTN|nr:MAG: cation:proton antiporter [Candidatus Solincola sediminis]OFW60438.1 MAG: cation:proton antiporter [Candidatus Solincola sediminis]OFW67551.1 MAG: cation:proton antiporter [Actinobacteria bacterium RBG_19FT_COMBO_54_7]
MRLLHNYHYIGAVILFCIGLYTVIVRRNIIKKLIGLNIMETAVFFFYISLGYVDNGIAPIRVGGADPSKMVNPIPQALILTGIVVAVSVTALALSLVILLYRQFGTLDVDHLMRDEAEEAKEAGE